MHFDDITRLLATECGLPALPSDANGAVAVAFGALVVNIGSTASQEAICLDARLGSASTLQPETVVAMMADNRWPHEACAGVLAVDAAGTVVLLHQLTARHMTVDRFRALLGRFAALGGHWRERLAQAEASAAQAPASNTVTLQALA